MRARPPANLQPPPGTPGWYGGFCDLHEVSLYHPETWSLEVQALYLATALLRFRHRWQRLLRAGDVALIRQQSGRTYLIRQVREELAEALQGAPTRNPYRVCPCHTRRLGGLPQDDKAREKDPLAILTGGR